MSWILILLMSNGVTKKINFNSEQACQKVKKEIILTTLPKLQTAMCVYDPKRRK